MRVIAQRVRQAAVSVGETTVGQIGLGLLVLAGFEELDQPSELDWMAHKLVKLRVFPHAQGLMN
jgi:D-aminoacyl-tRNA deacylase